MKRRDAGRTPWAVVGIVVAVAAVLGIAYYVVQGPPKDVKPLDSDVPLQEGVPKPDQETVKVSIPYEDSGEVRWREETRPATSSDPVVDSVNRFLGEGDIAPEARLVRTERDGNNLRLEFAELFGRGYGTDNEKILLDGILKAVRDNSDAATVEFFEDGRRVQGLGNLELEGPQPVPR